jgi:hypothetical protein
MKSSSTILILLMGLVCLFLGFYFGVYGVHPTNLKFEANINFADLISPLSSLLAAIFIVVFVEQKISKSKRAKELIVSYLGRIDYLADELSNLGNSYPLTEVNPKLKSMKSVAVTAKEITQRFPSSEAVLSDLSELIHKVGKLRKLITESPVRGLEEEAEACAAKVKDGIMQLADERAASIETTISDVRRLTIRSQAAIIEL